jgi:hypothetical protein
VNQGLDAIGCEVEEGSSLCEPTDHSPSGYADLDETQRLRIARPISRPGSYQATPPDGAPPGGSHPTKPDVIEAGSKRWSRPDGGHAEPDHRTQPERLIGDARGVSLR